MNKNLAGFLGAAAVLTMLAGCTAYDRTADQFTQPVVKDVKKGMTRSQVLQIAGKPSSEAVSYTHLCPFGDGVTNFGARRLGCVAAAVPWRADLAPGGAKGSSGLARARC